MLTNVPKPRNNMELYSHAIIKIAIEGEQGRIINVVCCVSRVELYKSKYKKVGVLPIRVVKSNVSSVALRQRRLRQRGCFCLTKGQRSKRFDL